MRNPDKLGGFWLRGPIFGPNNPDIWPKNTVRPDGNPDRGGRSLARGRYRIRTYIVLVEKKKIADR